MLTPSQYLDRKIATDGPWGVALMQISSQAGLDIPGIQPTPDEMTRRGSIRLKLLGHVVDSMGIFEWISLTLQQDPKSLSAEDASWLMANRLQVSTNIRLADVPAGYWSKRAGEINTSLFRAQHDRGLPQQFGIDPVGGNPIVGLQESNFLLYGTRPRFVVL